MTAQRVLVTGGGGFIGRNMIQSMLADGYTITALDSYRIGGKEFLPNDVKENVEWIDGDVRDYELVDRTVRGKDGIIHLAAPSSFLMYEEAPIDGTLLTTNGFLNILEAMRNNDVEKLVYASTSAVYEGNDLPYIEGMPLNPPDLKALSKKWNEEAANQYSQRYGITAIGMRPFSVYGPDEFSKHGYSNIISLFAWAALGGANPVIWGDGSQTRDFIHVKDAGRAFQLALEADIETNEFNVGTGIETSFAEVIQIISRKLNKTFELEFIPVPIAIYAQRLLADTSKAESILRFKHKISVEDGITEVIESARNSQARWPLLDRMQLYFETLPGGVRQLA